MKRWFALPALAAVLLLPALSAPGALAQAAPAGPQAGAYDSYANYDQLTERLRSLAGNRLATLSSIGKSDANRDLWLLTLGNESTGPLDRKPALLIVANLEGNHLVGSMAAIYTADHLISGYGSNDEVTQLLDTRTVYIIPRVNPDGAELYWTNRAYELPYKPHPSNPALGGLNHREIGRDLNGDGFVTMMRVRDPEGEYMVDPDDARLMRKADRVKQERGGYSLYVEGIEPAEMKRYLASGSDGVNLNRNFPHDYLFYQPHVGVNQVSERETRALADFAFQHNNIAVVLTFSPYDNLRSVHPTSARRPEGTFPGPPNLPTNLHANDRPYFEFVSERFREMTGLAGGGAENEAGSWPQFAYYQLGLPSFTTPVWGAPEAAPAARGAAGSAMPAASEGGVEGNWSIKLSMQGQEIDASLDVRRGEGGLLMSLASPAGGAELTGESRGNGFEGRGNLPQIGAISLTGQVSGDNMTGSVVLGPMGSAPFTGSRSGGGTAAAATPAATLAAPPAAPQSAARARTAGSTVDHRWLAYFEEHGIDGFLDWTEARHPTLGMVEVGGFLPNRRVNPPGNEIAELAKKHAEFAVWLGRQTPDVKVASTEVEARGDGVFLVKATLENNGYFPTRLDMGQRVRTNTPLSVRLMPASGVTILTGNPQEQISQIGGMGSRGVVTWLVQGASGTRLTLEVSGERSGGLQSTTVTLR